MTATLMLIWDYDGAVGQINASFPYNFDEEKIFQEIDNVNTILKLAVDYDFQMTFACLGFSAESGVFPYHCPDQIRDIYHAGHEIASHSWKHEWFPFLLEAQLVKSLERSKFALEKCIGQVGAVSGFVPPFSRPMSWYRRGAFSFGDRVFGPGFPGADLGTLLRFVEGVGYGWCRVTYRPLWQRWTKQRRIAGDWVHSGSVVCVPQHYVGFDDGAKDLLTSAVEGQHAVVIGGHPSGLSRDRNENLSYLVDFLRLAERYRRRGELTVCSVSMYLNAQSKKSDD